MKGYLETFFFVKYLVNEHNISFVHGIGEKTEKWAEKWDTTVSVQ